jgi:hypothetical protein
MRNKCQLSPHRLSLCKVSRYKPLVVEVHTVSWFAVRKAFLYSAGMLALSAIRHEAPSR